jgi:hypothetical protein
MTSPNPANADRVGRTLLSVAVEVGVGLEFCCAVGFEFALELVFASALPEPKKPECPPARPLLHHSRGSYNFNT